MIIDGYNTSRAHKMNIIFTVAMVMLIIITSILANGISRGITIAFQGSIVLILVFTTIFFFHFPVI